MEVDLVTAGLFGEYNGENSKITIFCQSSSPQSSNAAKRLRSSSQISSSVSSSKLNTNFSMANTLDQVCRTRKCTTLLYNLYAYRAARALIGPKIAEGVSLQRASEIINITRALASVISRARLSARTRSLGVELSRS